MVITIKELLNNAEGQFKLEVVFPSKEYLNSFLEMYKYYIELKPSSLWKVKGNRLCLDRFYYFLEMFPGVNDFEVMNFTIDSNVLVVEIGY